MSPLTPAGRAVVELMAQAPRGPKRDGLFAVWLTLRVVEDLAQDPPLPERAVKRRATLLERRLTSLSLPTPLRRGLLGILTTLPDARPRDAAALLALLATSARDGLGTEIGDRLARGLRATAGR